MVWLGRGGEGWWGVVWLGRGGEGWWGVVRMVRCGEKRGGERGVMSDGW